MTFTEVIVAAGLLLVAIVPILRALTAAQATGRIIEWRTTSLALAQGKLDEIRALCVHQYEGSFDESGTPLDGSYLCNVDDDEGADLRRIAVSVGFDVDGNGSLSGPEVQVALATYVARQEPGE